MGRKPHLTEEQADEAREMYRGPWKVRQIASYFKVSSSVVNAALNRTGAYARKVSHDPDGRETTSAHEEDGARVEKD